MNTTFSTPASHDNVLAAMPLSTRRRAEASPDRQAHMDSLMTQALTIAHNTPDIRQERIEAIRAQIANGEYEIDVNSIAESLIRENPALFEE